MKKILLIACVLGVVLFPACEGPEGPQGPPGFDGQDGRDGEDGEDGVSFVDLVVEAEVSFTAENEFAVAFDVEGVVFEDDNFLVFLEWGVANGRSVWRLLPQTVFLQEGILTYNYQFSSEFVAVFIESTINPAELPAEWTQNQLIRLVYMPGFFAQDGPAARLDLEDFDSVMKYLGKSEKDIVRIEKK